MNAQRPPFALYVIWHPSFDEGKHVADAIRAHFTRPLYHDATGEGLSVTYRTMRASARGGPPRVDWGEADVSLVVVLTDRNLLGDDSWRETVRALASDSAAPNRFFFPVAMEQGGLDRAIPLQAVRWDRWEGPDEKKSQQLLFHLTHAFIRLLQGEPTKSDGGSGDVQVFFCHTRQDDMGGGVASMLYDWLHKNSQLRGFLDVQSIKPGDDFSKVILEQIKSSALLAVHTDAFSSSEWCRQEVLEAKKHGVPMVVADCLRDLDDRTFPYMGNVPVVRFDPGDADRMGVVVLRLLDEVLASLMWGFLVERGLGDDRNVLVMSRPPELVSLATLPPDKRSAGLTVVHPGPKLSTDEERLLTAIVPEVRTRTLINWKEGLQ